MDGPRISRQDVIKVARLARLDLSEAEIERFAAQLGAVLEHVGRLAPVDTRDVPPGTHTLSARTPLREDVVQPGLAREDAVANAPAVEEGAFVVPRIVGAGSKGGA
ncbi:MAG: Asp-tRNA(Asn)/Glu-tRNA(Gln) amidotransferase subunit GatC [Micrococcales bacterium]|nr:Asp-tRNA(Asn)/Glu-tRNA(Gln) amidotransferase subunit GatC [Micrococcales bacterium]